MDSLEASGKTVEEAVARALRQLRLDRSQVAIDVVSQGRPGILGFGGEPARVVVRPLAEPDQPEPDQPEPGNEAEPPPARAAGRGGRRGGAAATLPTTRAPDGAASVETDDATVDDGEAVPTAVEIVEHMLELLGIEASVTPRPPATPGDGVGMVTAVIDIEGDDLGLLIGRRGETLAALQYIVNLMLARRTGTRVMVGIDVGGYRRRREDSLRSLATRIADRVRTTGQSITLEPMPPNERRIVHLALADSPHVMTVSIGEGESRKVAITPKR